MSLPIALAAFDKFPQFINWKLVPGTPKARKVPVGVNGSYIDAHNSQFWLPSEQAYTAATAFGMGVGYVFTANDPFVFIDIDNCLTEAGTWSDFAMTVVNKFPGAAVEISQSGKGLHIFVCGTVPPGYKMKNPALGLEVYTHSRFVALSNNEVTGDVWQDFTAQLAQFVPAYLEPSTGTEVGTVSEDWTTAPVAEYTLDCDDDELIRRMLTSGGAGQMLGTTCPTGALWNADEDVLGRFYPDTEQGRGYDASSADFALANHLAFWTGKNCERIEQLMRMSELVRDKWDKHPSYLRDMTILKAVASCKQVYDYSSENPIQRYGLDDTGNGYRFAHTYKCQALFCTVSKEWRIWDGKRFKNDDNGAAVRFTKAIAHSIYLEAHETAKRDQKLADQTAKWAGKSHDKTRLQAMLWAAQSELPAHPSELDQSDDILNLDNGTLDLDAFVLRDHSPQDRLTKISPVALQSDANCPEWDKFLLRIFGGDLELISFVQRAVGYSLTGDTSEHVLFMLYGTGANGKSTFLEALLSIAGDYGSPAEFRTFLSRQNSDAVRNDLAGLDGIRLVTAVEVGSGQSLDEPTIKQITGGDTIKARFLYKEYFSFKPRLKLWLAVNHKPQIKGADDGIWRRVLLIPFEVTIPPEERDKQLPAKLQAELPGILRWALEGLKQWRQIGLSPPDRVRVASAEYREESDRLADFIEDQCLDHKGDQNTFVEFSKLYVSYNSWCFSNQEKPVTKKTFATMLEERGYPSAKRHMLEGQKRVRLGLKLKSQG